jgi:SAM-dependent methyltransferase
MRTDILDLHAFYERPLGAAAKGFVAARIGEAWSNTAGLRVAGFGFAGPYLEQFDKAERVLTLAPDAQGVVRWPQGAANRASLVEENSWPLPDASIDRLLIAHGLEEAGDPRRLMREAWRVLTNDGKLIVVVSHRRGLWSVIDSTPFAAGRPYLKRQLNNLLSEGMFRAVAWSGALYFPPYNSNLLLRAANAWERAGSRAWPAFGGVLLVEAAKELLAPVRQAQRARIKALRPSPRPAPATRVADLNRR